MRWLSPLGVLGLWSALAVVAQRWVSIADGIREQFASDVRSYELIARASPSFPEQHVLRPFAERFPVHWLIGAIADLTGIPLEDVYRSASVLVVAGIVLVVHATLERLGLGLGSYALAAGALAASAYPLHYLLAAPGMVADGLFLLGLAVVLLGFTRERLALVLAGLVLATLGRQTAVPVALVAAACAAFMPAWWPMRWRAAAATALVPVGVYAVLRAVADPFAIPKRGDVHDLTVVGFMTSVHAFTEHVGKIAIGVMVPAALVAAAWWRARGPLPWMPLLLAAAVIAQPLLLGPSSTGDTEPRLAALATPALAVAAGLVLVHARLRRGEVLLLAAAIALAGLHPRYTRAPWDNITWATLELVAVVVLVGVLAAPRIARESPAVRRRS